MKIKDYVIFGALGIGLLGGIGITKELVSCKRYSKSAFEQSIANAKNRYNGDNNLAAKDELLEYYIKNINTQIKDLQKRTEYMTAGPVEGAAGSSNVKGLDKIFQNSPENKSAIDYRQASDRLKQAINELSQLEEYIRKSREALKQGSEVLESRAGGGLDIPDIPVIPEKKKESESGGK